jgi:hypothetical protein
MKKVLILMFMFVILGVSKLFCANEIYQNYGSYYDINISTSIAVVVSSTTYTLISAVNDGVSRRFKIIGDTSNLLFFRLDSNTSLITTNGLDLEPHTYYVENDYFGDIYFQATGGDVNLRYQILRRQS